jgi:hypothetical protein
MPRSRDAVAWLVLALGAVPGCAKLVGVDFDDPSLASGACAASRPGDASLRFGDFVPSLDRHDFCVTGDGDPSTLDAAPQGIGYEQVLAPVRLALGSYRVDIVRAGQGCAARPLLTTHVCLDGGSSTTVLILGDGAGQVQVDVFPETSEPTPRAPLRFVNAVASNDALDLGRIAAASLPATVTPLFTGVAYGTTAPRGTSPEGPVDDDGYLSLSPSAAELPLGAAPAGQSDATLVTSPFLVGSHRYTVIAAGSATDVRFPMELFVCDETQTDGPLTACGGAATDVTVETFNPFLLGPFSFHDMLRRGPIITAVGGLASDFVCLPGVYSDDDKRLIVTAALTNLPYSYWVGDGFDTPVDDPTDQNGNTPPAPTDPTCPAAAQGELSALLQCIEASCVPSAPNDPNATLPDDSLACIYQSCDGQVQALEQDAPECWLCAYGQFQSYTSFATTEMECTTNPAAGLGWGGASGVLLLSRYPLTDVSQWVLPSTLQRASLLEASVAIQSGTSLDVYCGILETPGDGMLIPYTGPYGNGLTGADAWRQELQLQVEKVVARVQTQSAARGRRAVVAAQWSTGPTVEDAPDASPDDLLPPNNQESFAVLSAAFPQASPPAYDPACTFCASNPLITPPGQAPSVANTWSVYPVLSGIPVTDVLSASVTLRNEVITYKTSSQKYGVPLSPAYAYRTTVRVRPR